MNALQEGNAYSSTAVLVYMSSIHASKFEWLCRLSRMQTASQPHLLRNSFLSETISATRIVVVVEETGCQCDMAVAVL